VDLAVDRRLVAVGAHRGPLQSGTTSGEPVLRPRQALVGTVEHPERILGMRGGADGQGARPLPDLLREGVQLVFPGMRRELPLICTALAGVSDLLSFVRDPVAFVGEPAALVGGEPTDAAVESERPPLRPGPTPVSGAARKPVPGCAHGAAS
jgi:hypothetical protein